MEVTEQANHIGDAWPTWCWGSMPRGRWRMPAGGADSASWQSLAGTPIQVPQVLNACEGVLDGRLPGVVAVDMRIGNAPIFARRSADDQVSREFGHAACSVHSPTPER
jgi:hypothetical protein